MKDFAIRPAEVVDLEQMLAIAENRRNEYSSYQPVFWHPTPDAVALQRSYFEGLILDSSVISLVAVSDDILLGFVIGQLVEAPVVYDPGGLTCSIDDFALKEQEDWPAVGATLLEAAKLAACERGAVQIVVVSGRLDEAKRSALTGSQMSIASEWWVAPLF